MAAMDKFVGKMKSAKFADDGPPTGSYAEGRTAGGADGEEPDMHYPSEMQDEGGGDEGDTGGDGSDVLDAAADDLADLAGVSPEDRSDWRTALHTYVSACMSSSDPDVGGDQNEEG
jgi:hypothetical protein